MTAFTKNTPGAPNSGTYNVGDTVTDSVKCVWVCVLGGPARASTLGDNLNFVGCPTPVATSLRDTMTAHAGGTQAGAIGDAAAALTGVMNRLTVVGSAGDSVVLPAAVAGINSIVVVNDTATSANVFPFTGDSINALGANAAFALAAGKTAEFFSVVNGKWHGILSA